ncbi:hypothetical protein AX774_g3829 [Zancudomyces culisetae]|uniref:Uncharacterized protein n=1 Tax=Zancudomyces culisetae TaxID=1213189 RepID=A0A1R1PEJ4_ZANCU|nr:hypothetical protein AX774_g7193 [Zancudomyces culisetae]OMH82676.1 hypothetical protein AX774_g3829 [Zancudomyces culisetae]|eukprot:OMH79381.1 hypothetical protein AX774_g7193 [Zancudomyces culisetae]
MEPKRLHTVLKITSMFSCSVSAIVTPLFLKQATTFAVINQPCHLARPFYRKGEELREDLLESTHYHQLLCVDTKDPLSTGVILWERQT